MAQHRQHLLCGAFTHEAHAGLVQVNGLPQRLGRCPNLGQLPWQVLHEGQQLSPHIVSRDSVLLARVVELLPQLGGPRLALLLLAAVFLLQLLALGDLLLQRGDLIVDVPNQEARELH